MAGYNTALIFAALLSFMAALLHFSCIFWGTKGFKFLGAGEPIISLSAAGHWYPPFIALVIGTYC